MRWSLHPSRWFAAPLPPPPARDWVGERLRAVVSEHARVKADCIRAHERRVQSMIAELFVRLGERDARHDP